MKLWQNKQTNQPMSLQKYLFHECEAMAKYAFASGLKVPGNLMQTFQIYTDQSIRDHGSSNTVEEEHDPSENSLKRLAYIHEELSKIIAPATPRTIFLLDHESTKHNVLSFLGPIPLIRELMVTAMLFLTALVSLSLSASVNGQVDWQNESGYVLLLEELFLISAAGLGAIFAALFQANRYVLGGTFDPKYNKN